MMHKLLRCLTVAGLMAGSFVANAQQPTLRKLTPNAKVNPAALKPMLAPRALTGLEAPVNDPTPPSIPASPSILRSNLSEEIVGTTYYDLQTNGTESARVHVWDNGDVAAVYTMSQQPEGDGNGFADRGTAYNFRTNGAWGPSPIARIENVRTGFSNYVVTEDGTEFTVAHRAVSASSYRLAYARRAAGATTWTQGDMPTNLPNGVLWSKAAVDGNTIYVMALSTPSAFSGPAVFGMNGHPLLYRSKDAGLTWDIVDGIVPGLDQTKFAELGSDDYALAARDGILAVGIFSTYNDVMIFKSLDGGDNWGDPYTIIDFPLEKYVIDAGYTEVDLGGADPNAPNPLASFNTDGSVSMIIDVLGNVQMFSGETYFQDDVLDDGLSSYYPGINGLMYWSEADPTNLFEIAGALDPSGNDTLDFIANSIVGYGTGLSSMPAAGSDENAFLYVVYSAALENTYDLDGKAYRHLYIMKSTDLGGSWSFPIDVTYATDPDQDSVLANLSEAVYPSAFKQVKNEKFHYVYQRDFAPGAALILAGNQPSSSDIVYIADSEIVLSTKNVNINTIGLSVNPNPAVDFAQVSFTLSSPGKTTVEVVDLAGNVVRSQVQGDLGIGGQVVNLNTTTLQNGMYIVRVRSGNQIGVKKMVVMH